MKEETTIINKIITKNQNQISAGFKKENSILFQF